MLVTSAGGHRHGRLLLLLAVLVLALAVPMMVEPALRQEPSSADSGAAVTLAAGSTLAVVPAVTELTARSWTEERPLKVRVAGLMAVLVLLVAAALTPRRGRPSLRAGHTSLAQRRNSISLRAPPLFRFS